MNSEVLFVSAFLLTEDTSNRQQIRIGNRNIMKNPMCIKIAALLLALSFVEPRVAYADAKEDAAQAAKDIDAAYKEAQENIPNGTVKPNEDKLDEAAQKNDNTPATDPNKPNTEKPEKDARDHPAEMNKPFTEAEPRENKRDKYRQHVE